MNNLTSFARSTRFLSLAVCWSLLIFTEPVSAISPPNGVAPVLIPAGGFAIEGNLLANTPTNGVGDWIAMTNLFPGAGRGVLASNGLPFDASTTFHFTDPYSSATDTIMLTGSANGNPNAWTWGTGSVQTKEDLNNGLVHIARDASDHIWIIVSADHTGTGDADMYFYFLQNALTKNVGGTFTSGGLQGGLTTNDLRMKLNFSGNSFTADQWQTNTSGGGYAWKDVTASLPANRVFLAVNTSNTYVPYGTFGSTNAPTGDFVEAAADFTGLIGNINSCASAGFRNVFIVTLHPNGAMSDFIDPIQANVIIGLAANAGPDQTNCYQGATTTFTLSGTVSVGGVAALSTNWTVVSGAATITSPGSLNTTVQVPSSTAGTNVTLRLTITSTCSNKTDDVVLTVAPQSTPCQVTGPATVCPASSNQFSGPVGASSYAWSISGNGSISGATNLQSVSVLAGTNCAQNFTLSLVTVSNLCPTSCSLNVLVNDTNPPSITCPSNITVTAYSSVPAPDPASLAATDDCGAPVKSFVGDNAVTNGPIVTITRTYAATDLCGNQTTCTQTITADLAIPTTATALTNLVLCPGASADFSTTAGGTGPFTYVWRMNGILQGSTSNRLAIGAVSASDAGTYSVEVTGYLNTVTNSATLTVNTNTSATALTNLVLCPGQSASFSTIADGTGPFAYVWSKGGVVQASTSNSLNIASVSANDAGTYTVVVAGVCNSVTNSATLTVNKDVAITNSPASVTNCVGGSASFSVAATGTGLSYQWTFSGTVISTSNSVSLPAIQLSDAGDYTVVVSGVCAGPITNVATLTVLPLPVIMCNSNRTVEFGNAWTFDAPTANYPVTIVSTVTNANCGSTFTATRTWVAADPCGNTNACSQTVTVVDTTVPVINCVSNITLSADFGRCDSSNVTFVVTATDNDTVATLTSVPPSGSTFPVGVTTVISTATDACGNSNTCSFTVTVIDNEPPTVFCPLDVIVAANSGCNATNVALGRLVSSDNCAVAFVTNNLSSLGLNPVAWWPGQSNTLDIVNDHDGVWQGTTAYGAGIVGGAFSLNGSSGLNVSDPASFQVQDFTIEAWIKRASTTLLTLTPWPFGSDNNGVLFSSGAYSGYVFGLDSSGRIFFGKSLVSEAGRSTTAITDTSYHHIALTKSGSTVRYFIDGVLRNTFTYTDVFDTTTNAAVGMHPVIGQNAFYGAIDDMAFFANVLSTNDIAAIYAAGSAGLCGTPAPPSVCGPTNFSIGTNFVTWTVTDIHGNSNSCVQRVIVQDAQSPTITCSGDLMLTTDPGQCSRSNVTYTVTFSDNCSGAVLAQTSGLASGATFPKGTTTNTFTVTDGNGNSNTCSFTVTINDAQPPAITCPADVTVSADINACTATSVSLGTLVTSDNCAVATVVSNAPASYPLGTNLVTRIVTDTSGNTNSCTQRVIVRDTQQPTIACPANLTLSTNPGQCSRSNVTYNVLFSDNCTGATLIQTAGLASGATFPKGTTTNRFVVTDGSGNSNACSFTVTVNDTQPPAISCPADVIASANSGCAATNVALGTPITSDNCGVASVSNNVPALSPVAWWPGNGNTVDIVGGNNGTIMGNATYTAAKVGSGFVFDGMNDAILVGNPPKLRLQNLTIEAWVKRSSTSLISSNVTYGEIVGYGAGGYVLGFRADGSMFLSKNTVGDVRSVGTIVDLGWHHVAVSKNGSSVTFYKDGVAEPAITYNTTFDFTTDLMIGAIYSGADFSFLGSIDELAIYDHALTGSEIQAIYAAGNAGLCGTPTPPSVCGTGNFNLGTNLVTWTVTDTSGNTNSCIQRVIVRDATPPTITCPGNLILTNDPGQCSRSNVNYSVTFGDNCAGATLTQTAGLASGATFPNGTTTNRFVVTDASGNMNTCSFTVKVNDAQSPTITCPSNMIFAANPGGCTRSNVAFNVTAADNCGAVTVVSVPPSGSAFPAGTTVVTNTATDASSNKTVCTFTVTVTDAQPPVIVCPTNLVLATDAGSCSRSNVALNVTATDVCGSVTVVTVPPSGGTFPVGVTTVTATATDNSGNSNTCTFTVTVNYSSTGNPETGLIVLMGIDAEDGTVASSTHGPILTWQTLGSNMLKQAVGGSGILVFGGGKVATDDVTRFWNAIGAYNGQSVTYANGAAAIASVPISSYKMIGIASDVVQTASGGLTVAENNALATRAGDIASFINSGRALLGFSSLFTASAANAGPFAYMSGVGGVTLASLDFSNIDPLAAGLALGVDNTLDVSSWHQYFLTYPKFLKPLANVAGTTNVAALGGKVNVPLFTLTCFNAVTSACPSSITVTGQVYNTACQVLTVTWRVDGVAVQTNTITPSSANADVTLTRAYDYGVHTVSMAGSDGLSFPTCTSTVTVNGGKPVITCPANLTLPATPGQCSRTNVTFAVGASNVCGGAASVVSSPASGSTFQVGTTTVTSTANDGRGNTNVCTFTVTITNSTAPTITCPGNLTLAADPGQCSRANVTFNVGASSLCGGAVTVISTPPSGSTFPVGTTTVRSVATDVSGNTNACTFTVTITPNNTTSTALAIRLNSGQIELSWPTNAAGFHVQKTTSIVGGGWVDLPNVPVIVGQEYRVIIGTPTAGVEFYRLAGVSPCGATQPVIRIEPVGAQVKVSWLTTVTGFRLQSSAAVGPAAVWTTVTNTPVIGGGSYQVILDPNLNAKFFRLINP